MAASALDPSPEHTSNQTEELPRHLLEFDVADGLPPKETHGTRLLRILTPTILRAQTKSSISPRSTAYLDGVRGLAAFVVYLAHNLLAANHLFTPLEVAFGFEGQHNLINFPILRVLFTGSHVAVPIFFVISGYVQARKPVRHIHEQQDVSSILASALFRRWFRLFLPVIGSTFFFMTLWHLLGIKPSLNHHEPTYLADLKFYFKELWYWTYPSRTKHQDYFHDHQAVREAWFLYNGHTWTIPTEFQSSIILLLTLFTLSKTTTRARLWLMTLSAVYFLVQGSCYTFTFLVGGILAELEYHTPQSFIVPNTFKYRTQLFILLLLGGCYLGTPPVFGLIYMSSEMVSQQPGWYYLSKLAPWVYYDTIHFYVSVGAAMIVTSIMALPILQKPFESRLLQYFGRISFSLYLVHGPIIETLGIGMYMIVGKVPGETWYQNMINVPAVGPLGFDAKFLVANIVILPITLYVAEIFMSVFDAGSIVVANHVYQSVLR